MEENLEENGGKKIYIKKIMLIIIIEITSIEEDSQMSLFLVDKA